MQYTQHNEAAVPKAPPWKIALGDAIRSASELLEFLDLDPKKIKYFEPKNSQFPMLVPRNFAARMNKNDPHDPLLKQVLPDIEEKNKTSDFVPDPLQEFTLTQHGFLKKYPNRALLITTAACPVHCRYCFRRHFPYKANIASSGQWDKTIQHIKKNEDIKEIILSGGDPLSLSTQRLEKLLVSLTHIKSVEIVRVHTRFPIILPERIDQGLLDLIVKMNLPIVIVVHCNHPNEINNEVMEGLQKLRSTGSTLLNQSVLLKGINDEAAILKKLSERLFECGVLPYYLHLLDPVTGTQHYKVDDNFAKELITTIKKSLPGYLVPKLVREVPGELSKITIA